MKALKTIICCLLIISDTALLFGCSDNAAVTGANDFVSIASTSGTLSEPVTINWLSFRGDDEQINGKLIKKFEYEYPGLRVAIRTIKEESQYYNKLDLIISSGEELEIFQTHTSSYMVKLAKKGLLEDLTNCPFSKNVFENILPITTIDGKVVAMLQSVNLILVYYNKKIFEKYKLAVPSRFEKLMEIVEKLKDNGEGGIAYPGKTVKSRWVFNMVSFPQLTPEGYVKMWDGLCSGRRTTISDIPEMVNTYYILADIYNSRLFYEDSYDIDIVEASELFAKGKAPMMVMGTWKIGTAGKEFPDIDFGVFPFPLNDKMNAAYGEAGQATAIYSKSKNIEEAKRFMEFLFSPEVENIYCTETKQTPTIKGVKANYDMQYLVSDVMEKGFYILQPVSNDQYENFLNIFEKSSENVLFNGCNVDDEINTLESKLITQLKSK